MTGNDRPVTAGEILAASLRHVTAQHRIAEAARANRLDAIAVARSLGASWTDIGQACDGMSRQTANKRFAEADQIQPKGVPS